MAISVLLIFAISLGGAGFTYLIFREATLLWRLSVGCALGTALFGVSGFLLGSSFRLTSPTVVLSLLITLAPLLVFLDPKKSSVLRHERDIARGRTQGTNLSKLLGFAFYLAFLILFIAFFDRAYIETAAGIFTGGSNNLGDLPFHLGAIYSFTEGGNLPPQNPNFAGAKFTYPFIADLVTAMFMTLGAGVREAMLVQNVSWAFALLVVLERFASVLVKNRAAARLAVTAFFFSGGLGFLWFTGDMFAEGGTTSIWQLPKDYTIGDEFRWGNVLTTLLLTQRSLILGMPIALAAATLIWQHVSSEREDLDSALKDRIAPMLLFGLAVGVLPLIHVHSLLALFVVGVVAFALRPDRWPEWVAFAVGVGVISLPMLAWTLTGSATRTTEFLGFHFGWDMRDNNFLWFWIKNTGLLIPLAAAGLYLVWTGRLNVPSPEKRNKKQAEEELKKETKRAIERRRAVSLYCAFAVLFVVSNIFKLAPWEWDNIKVLVYWLAGTTPFAAVTLVWLWRQGTGGRIASVACALGLVLSGGLDVWRTVSGQINYRVFSTDAIAVADRVRASTRPDTLFLNAPTYNSAVVLTGRRSFMRYPGHLSSHGIDFRTREEAVRTIYRGGPAAVEKIRELEIDYVLISPEERNSLQVNEAYFAQFPIAAEAGDHKVYRVSEPSVTDKNE